MVLMTKGDGGGAAQVFGCYPCAQEVRVQTLSSGLGSKVPIFIPVLKKKDFVSIIMNHF